MSLFLMAMSLNPTWHAEFKNNNNSLTLSNFRVKGHDTYILNSSTYVTFFLCVILRKSGTGLVQQHAISKTSRFKKTLSSYLNI